MSGFQKALPIALAAFCGVIGGVYTFQPILAPKDPIVEGREKTVPATQQTKPAADPTAAPTPSK
ncbi:hypothetical protein JDV02_002663 [Purpureocillium takamizusanense]|uniref:Uncharacterized protein n=1 Tax=Purpureocillium takamizusanense TaxID=2060973 RepID=A0A9Q8V7Y9_9HYPO|nr:uncharacterized protein JDV02_002663 [Purpureocillium takamizusanense]UNI16203.1 hypothetical protein JDV02_002663 [Purpureocillium takamizusanense]